MNLTYLEVDHQQSYYNNMPHHIRGVFWDRLVLSWLYHDHALEGVVLTQTDLARALNGMPCRNYCDGLVHNSLRRMRACIDHIHKSAARGDELTMDWIKDLHVRMCSLDDEAAGRYRKRDTSPGVYNLDVAPAASISYYFRKFMDAYNDEIHAFHPIRAAAIAHWEFMRVFPFDERTGLVGRLMMNFILLRHNYPPALIHATERHNYFAALNGHRTDAVPVVVEAITSTIAAAKSFSRQQAAPLRHQMAL